MNMLQRFFAQSLPKKIFWLIFILFIWAGVQIAYFQLTRPHTPTPRSNSSAP